MAASLLIRTGSGEVMKAVTGACPSLALRKPSAHHAPLDGQRCIKAVSSACCCGSSSSSRHITVLVVLLLKLVLLLE